MSETLWQKFHVGQRVWCKLPSVPRKYRNEKQPVVGCIYTIRELLVADGEAGCKLEEIVNAPLEYYSDGASRVEECGFYLWRFEPVREQNIEIFRKMCREADQKVSA